MLKDCEKRTINAEKEWIITLIDKKNYGTLKWLFTNGFHC